MKSPSLRYYHDRLGDAGEFEPKKYESDEDAASDLSAHTNFDNMHAMELLDELLSGCGWLEKTEEDYEALKRAFQSVSDHGRSSAVAECRVQYIPAGLATQPITPTTTTPDRRRCFTVIEGGKGESK